MDYFPTAYALTMKHEGFFSTDKDDPGGMTWKGIARNRHPSWAGWHVVDDVRGVPPKLDNQQVTVILNANQELEVQVMSFYRSQFWETIWGDRLGEHSPDISIDMFDLAVNLGVGRAVTFLQESLNALNRNGYAWADILEDGAFGNKTMGAFLACMGDHKTGERKLYKLVNISQGAWYKELMRSNPARFEKYIGWFDRVDFMS